MLPLRMLVFLTLMFSLCDADSLCPTDLYPLTLDPPEVIKEYKESVLVNCTSTEEDHEGMYWTVGNKDSPTEYDNSYIQATLSNWDVTAECKIKLNGTHECSKDLKITVYKNPEMVSVFPTRHVPIVEGTPFELQCDIINVAPIQNLTVRWYKHNQVIMNDSFTNTTKTPVNESSTLAINISRDDNGAEFRCEAQLDFGLHGSQPVTSETYTVTVLYAPELKNKTEDVYMNEYNDITLNCDAEGHPPPHFHWTCDGLNISENTNNLNIRQVITSTTCNCTATNHLGSINKLIHVHVIPRGCPLVVTPAEMVVRFGDPASVNCSTDADVQQMGWKTPVGAISTTGPAVIWKVEKLEDWQITPLCYINLKDNYQCSKELTITLYKTPDVVSVSALDDGPMVEGIEYHLKCDIINVAPVQKLKVTWYRNNETVHTEMFNGTSKVPVNVSSTLRVTPVGDYNGAHFICKADLQLGPNGPETDAAVTSSPYMAVLQYADSLCPTDRNPLTLDPPEVIKEYEESVLVNCTSTEDDHDGMYWTVGNKDSPTEYDNSYIQATLSNWDVTAECKIKLNDTHECSKHLKITVYKSRNGQRFPTRYVPIVEGTPFELQCDIINVAPIQNLTVRWYKNNQAIMNDSFTNTTKTPVSESSTLAINISRDDNGAEFRCEAQLDFGPHGSQPVTSETYTVTVLYAPELKNKTEDVYMNEYNDITLNCDAEGHPPPHFHWTCDGLNILENTNNLNIRQVITSTTCNCTATNNLGSINKQIHVHVIPRGCPLVVTPAEMVVRFGDPASVNCSTDADVQQMGWETPVGATSTTGPAVIWKVEKLEDWQITPLCYINLKDNYQCFKELTITLYKTPDVVSVSALDDGPMVEGIEYHLKCDIINVAPVQKLKVTWYRDNETVHTEVFNGTSTVPVNVSSTLRVTPVGDYNGAHFICKADLQLGPNGPETDPAVTSSPYMAVVHYKPVFKACPGSYAGLEHEFSMDKLSCLADGNPPPILKWKFEGDLINASEHLTRAQSGTYTAEIANDLGTSTTPVVITIEYGASFTCEDRYKVKENENGKLPCEPEGIPKPTITWSKDGKEIVSPQRWTKHDSGNYSLIATNKHGTANHVLHLDVLYAPLIKKGTNNMEVNLGENVTIDCSAEGNPVPEIHWKYSPALNVKNTTWGRQKRISITGATSTNAAVYSCVAINEVGNVTRSVTLTIKGKTSEASSIAIWLLLIILIAALIPIILIILIIVHNRCKKHGQYSFVPDKANDGSELPMTPLSNGVQT